MENTEKEQVIYYDKVRDTMQPYGFSRNSDYVFGSSHLHNKYVENDSFKWSMKYTKIIPKPSGKASNY